MVGSLAFLVAVGPFFIPLSAFCCLLRANYGGVSVVGVVGVHCWAGRRCIVVVVVVVVSVALLPIALYRVRDVPRCAVSCGFQPFSN